jgi:hypothetical protein
MTGTGGGVLVAVLVVDEEVVVGGVGGWAPPELLKSTRTVVSTSCKERNMSLDKRIIWSLSAGSRRSLAYRGKHHQRKPQAVLCLHAERRKVW